MPRLLEADLLEERDAYIGDPGRVGRGGFGGRGASQIRPRVHTTLSIVESRNVIRAGHSDVVSGRLASRGIGLSGHIVYLDRVVDHKLVPVRAEITGRHGGVAFTVRPGVTARYELVYLGNKNLAPTHSGIVTVKVTH